MEIETTVDTTTAGVAAATPTAATTVDAAYVDTTAPMTRTQNKHKSNQDDCGREVFLLGDGHGDHGLGGGHDTCASASDHDDCGYG